MKLTRCMAGSAFVTFCVSAFAAPQASTPPVIVVTCIDVDSKPVAGAEVHVFQMKQHPDGTRMHGEGPFITREDGTARTAVAVTQSGGHFDRWVYALVPGKLVGGVRRLPGQEGDPDSIVVRLLPSRSVRGHVNVPGGLAPNSVRVRVLALSRIDGEDLHGADFPRQLAFRGLQDTLPERFDFAVRDDGTFVLTDLPEKPFLYLAADGEGMARAHFGNGTLPGRTLPDPVVFTLEPESVLAGRIRAADGSAAANATVRAEILNSGPNQFATFEGKTDARGGFRLVGLPAAIFDVSIQSTTGVFRPRRLNLSIGQRVSDFAATLEIPVEVTGHVVSEGDRKPVEGVSMIAITDTEPAAGLGDSVTTASGRFVLRLPRGVARLYLRGLPPEFAYPDPHIVATLDVGGANGKPRELRFELVRKGK